MLYPVAWSILSFCVVVSLQWRTNVGLAGDPQVYSIMRPLHLIFHDIFLVSAFFALLGLALLLQNTCFAFLGRFSLVIYLFHSFVWQGLIRFRVIDYFFVHGLQADVIIVISFLLTMLLSLAGGIVLRQCSVLQSFVFPRQWDDWPPVMLLDRH